MDVTDARDIQQGPVKGGEKRLSRFSQRRSLVGLAVAGVSLTATTVWIDNLAGGSESPTH